VDRLGRSVDLTLVGAGEAKLTPYTISEFCGNPAAETGEALMPSEPFNPVRLSHLVENIGAKQSPNSTDPEPASNVKLTLGTW
jgi:hypothetical protein